MQAGQLQRMNGHMEQLEQQAQLALNKIAHLSATLVESKALVSTLESQLEKQDVMLQHMYPQRKNTISKSVGAGDKTRPHEDHHHSLCV